MKQQLLCRRIRLEQGRTVFTIAPAFVMPYMTGRTQPGMAKTGKRKPVTPTPRRG
jgi:hypothetical protein